MIEVLTWENEKAPKNSRFMARLLIDGKFSPVVGHGDDREELESRMEKFVESEKYRYGKKPVPSKKAAEPSAPQAVDLDDLLS